MIEFAERLASETAPNGWLGAVTVGAAPGRDLNQRRLDTRAVPPYGYQLQDTTDNEVGDLSELIRQ